MSNSVDSAIHLSDIEATDVGLSVRWSDENVSFFHHIWLRDNCRCPACGEPSTGRRKLRLSGIPKEIIAVSATIDRDDILTINWSDGHQSSYSGAWLKTYTYNEDAERSVFFRHRFGPKRLGKIRPSFRLGTSNRI